MSRDYKQGRSANSKGSKGGTVLGIFIGLVIGILIALAVVWYMNRTPAPFVNRAQQAPEAAAKPGNGSITTPGNGGPTPLPGKPGEAPAEKRFQFYDILPGKSEPKPEIKTAEPADPAKREGKAGGALALQVGSFQNMKDAENMKASLALMGVEPSIQQVSLNDKVWYRVRLGPLANFEELNRVKNELAKAGMQAAVVKANE
jgi:cell division protein FtsN